MLSEQAKFKIRYDIKILMPEFFYSLNKTIDCRYSFSTLNISHLKFHFAEMLLNTNRFHKQKTLLSPGNSPDKESSSKQ